MIFQEASLSGVIRIIFYILLASFIIRLIARLALPYVIRKSEQAMREKAAEFYARKQQEEYRKEGEVRVEKNKNTGSSKKDEGDYVDFIEIKN
jgi:hypothetical protein